MIYCLISKAQNKDGTEYILNADDLVQEFKSQDLLPGKIPFKEIVILDYRFDTSKIGYVIVGKTNSTYSRIKIKSGWTETIKNYYAENLYGLASYTLVFVIRSFWMQQGIIDDLTSKKVILKDWGSKDGGGSCKVAIDLFVQTDTSYYPLFKIEDTFLNGFAFKPSRLKESFFLPFDSITRRIATLDIPSLIAKRSKLSLMQIEKFYASRIEKKVLSHDAIINKGIFLNFEDFLTNTSVSKEFRIANGKLTDELYTINSGEETIVADFWGVFDGKTLFIRSGFSIYPAIKQQNTFEVYGAKHINNVHNAPQAGDLIRINNMGVDEKILQLNMETGKFY